MSRYFRGVLWALFIVTFVSILAFTGSQPARAGSTSAEQQTLSCTNLLTNSDMESSAGWTFGVTPARAEYVTDRYLSPYRSILLGVISKPNVHSYSSMQQLVNVPVGSKLVLRAHVYPLSQPYDGDDAQELIIMNATGQPLRRIWTSISNARAWQTLEFDISEFMGMPIGIYFNVFNDGAGGVTAMYIDDVTLEICYGSITNTPSAPTPTPTPIILTATPTPLPTSTPVILTATPTPTPHVVTATPTPIVVTNTPTPTATPGFITATPTPIVVTNTPTSPPLATLTPTPTPGVITATPTVPPSATPIPLPMTPIPPGVTCEEAVFNGGFETNGGWTFGKTKLKGSYTGLIAHNGLRSVRLGNDDYAKPNRRSYSSVSQSISLRRLGKTTARLSFWYFPISDMEPGDTQEAILLDARTGRTIEVLWRTNENTQQWTQHSPIDLTPYLGRDVIIYFNVFNNGGAGRAAMYVDDVSIVVCGPVVPTSTPTAAAVQPIPTTQPPTVNIPVLQTVTPTGTVVSPIPTPTPITGAPAAVAPTPTTEGVPLYLPSSSAPTPAPSPIWDTVQRFLWMLLLIAIGILVIAIVVLLGIILWRQAGPEEESTADEEDEFQATVQMPEAAAQTTAPMEAPEEAGHLDETSPG